MTLFFRHRWAVLPTCPDKRSRKSKISLVEDHFFYKFTSNFKQVSDKSNKYLSVGNPGILSIVVVVIFVLVPACTNLRRGPEYLLKVRYIILVDLLFSISNTVFCYGMETLSYVKKHVEKSGICVW